MAAVCHGSEGVCAREITTAVAVKDLSWYYDRACGGRAHAAGSCGYRSVRAFKCTQTHMHCKRTGGHVGVAATSLLLEARAHARSHAVTHSCAWPSGMRRRWVGGARHTARVRTGQWLYWHIECELPLSYTLWCIGAVELLSLGLS